MARLPMVTRTIVTTDCTTVLMNTESNEVFENVLSLPRTYKDDNAVLKALKKTYETDTIKVVYVKETTTVETLYGIPETEFIKIAKKLDPETRKIAE